MSNLKFRRANESDIQAIVAMLVDDALGALRETTDLSVYRQAFAEIESDPNQFLCVAENDGQVVGSLQLTFIPGLSRGGSKRGQIEAVRVVNGRRGEGIGEALFRWAIQECRARGCSLVQLTTDKSRIQAHRFYERLGFSGSHIGFKLVL